MSDSFTEIKSGRLRGARERGVCVFRNIPYANVRRFRSPEPGPAWPGVRDATRRGPVPPQAPSRLEMVSGPPGDARQSEDCLVVTVTTPALDGSRPVIAWLHGGAYVSGGGELPWYDAHALAYEGEVVVVSITYRLGVFGYLWSEDEAARNLGLADQAAALAWIQRNIAAFGGDPRRVTLAGQSAGGHAIAALLASGETLYRRAILASAPLGLWPKPETAAAFAVQFAEAVGDDPLGAETAKLLAAQGQVIAARREGLPVAPVIDGSNLTRAGVDILAGWTRDDASPFVRLGLAGPSDGGLHLETVAPLTEQQFAGPTRAFAALSSAGAGTFLYQMDWRPRGSPFGACHVLDAALVFGGEAAWRAAPMLGDARWSEVETLGRQMRGAWAAFAHTGDPSSEVGGAWAPWRPGDEVRRLDL